MKSKKHKNNKKAFLSVMLMTALILSLHQNVYAKDEADYTVTKTYLTDDATESRNDDFEKELNVDGKKYQLSDIQYKILKTNDKPDKTIESDPVPDGQDYSPDKEILEDGITYKLKESVAVEKEIEKEYVQQVDGYTDYDYPITKNSVPDVQDFTVTNMKTGELETVSCQLQDVTQLDGTWTDTYIDIVFESYDADTFNWQNVQVTKNTETPLAGYESQLLQSVGANTQDYRVESTYWTSQPYTDANGILCRNARADVQRYIRYYRANYSGQIKMDAVQGRIFTSVYEYEKGAGDHYEIEATANYEEVSTVPYLAIGAGVLILVLLIVCVLYAISKKKKKEEVE